MRPDLLGLGVLLGRNVAGFLEKRYVDEGIHIAPAARIAVPIPDAAKVPAGLDDPDIVDTGLPKVQRRQHAGPTAADHHDVGLVFHGRAVQRRLDIWIVQEVRKFAVGPSELRKSVGANALGPFYLVFLE
jgi:hypothetical protein